MKIPPANVLPDQIKWFDNQPLPDLIYPDPPLPEKSLSDMPVGE